MRTTTILALALTAAVPALSVPFRRPLDTIGVSLQSLPQGITRRDEPAAWASRELAGGHARQEQPKEGSVQWFEWYRDHSDKTQVGLRDVELNSELARRGKVGEFISKVGHSIDKVGGTIDKVVKTGRDEELNSELARRGKAGEFIGKLGHTIDKIVKIGRDEINSELARRGKAGEFIGKLGHTIDKIVKIGRDEELNSELARRGKAGEMISKLGHTIDKIVKIGRDLDIVNEYVRRELQEEGSGASFMLGELAARQVGSGALSPLAQGRHFIMPVLGNLL
ncbi:hypothetical protein B0H21DRAFT_705833 [Amylocystis lapponica]|nr:hypothetical protein B0H21DRAFT_705833 [Amylocystis lapponica]